MTLARRHHPCSYHRVPASRLGRPLPIARSTRLGVSSIIRLHPSCSPPTRPGLQRTPPHRLYPTDIQPPGVTPIT
jgi:hypothetical protein